MRFSFPPMPPLFVAPSEPAPEKPKEVGRPLEDGDTVRIRRPISDRPNGAPQPPRPQPPRS
jgi:hypothetical protein